MLLNWLGDRVADAALSLAFSKKLHGWMWVRIRTADITDVFKGDIESLDVSCHSGRYKGIALGSAHIHTGPLHLNYRTCARGPRGLRAPAMVSIDGIISQADLTRDLESKDVTDNLRFLKFDLPGLGEQHLQVLKPHVELSGDEVTVRCQMATAGGDSSTGIALQAKAIPELDKQRYVRLRNIQIQSGDISDPVHFGPFLEMLFNPLIDLGRFDRFTHAMRLTSMQVKDGKVRYSACLCLVPKRDEKTGYSAPFLLAHPEIKP